MEFEEKADIDDLVLPSEPMKLAEIEIKQEPVEGNKFKLRMEESILKLYSSN